MKNRYPGKCFDCGNHVLKNEGHLERRGKRWKLWCRDCFNRSDNSSHEDRACGNRAYEDACARACGLRY